MSEWKPDGYNSASPYIMVSDARATLEFLRAVFGAEPLRIMPRDDGSLLHAEVRIGDSVVMFAGAVEGWPAVPAYVHVYVPDVDACYQRAVGSIRARAARRRARPQTFLSDRSSSSDVAIAETCVDPGLRRDDGAERCAGR